MDPLGELQPVPAAAPSTIETPPAAPPLETPPAGPAEVEDVGVAESPLDRLSQGQTPTVQPQPPLGPAQALDPPGLGWRIGNAYFSSSAVDTALEYIADEHLDQPDMTELTTRGIEAVAERLDVEVTRDGDTLRLQTLNGDTAEFRLPSDPSDLADTTEEILETLRRASPTELSWEEVERSYLQALPPHLDERSRFIPDRGRNPPGLGLNLRQTRDGSWFTLRPAPDSPAGEAGIPHGARITHLGSLELASASAEDISAALAGTNVDVTYQVGGTAVTVPLERSGYLRDAVTLEDVDQNGIAHIVITRMDGDVTEQVRAILEDPSHTLTGVVLDLRGNAGGLTNEAVELVQLFRAERHLMYQAERVDGPGGFGTVRGPGTFDHLRLAVLVDSETASAAELVVGGLSRNLAEPGADPSRGGENRAIVIGSSSFGKATEQRRLRFTTGDQLTYTMSNITVPVFGADNRIANWASYEGRGYTPGLCTHGANSALAADEGTVRALIGAAASCGHELRLDNPEDLAFARAVLADADLYAQALEESALGIAAER